MIAASATVEIITIDLVLMGPSRVKKQDQIHVIGAAKHPSPVANASHPWRPCKKLIL